jgi:two-component system nitrate/nitrite response regulator NarL
MDDLAVLVIAREPLARAGLSALLGTAGYRVVAEGSPREGLARGAALYRPDVVVWDLGWEAADAAPGAALLDEVAEAEAPVVALVHDEADAAALLGAGAAGVLLREAPAERLYAALRAVAEGLTVIDAGLPLPALRPAERDGLERPVEDLTPRELEVLDLLAEGLTNRAIAQRLGISEHTVKFHLSALMGKLGAQSRTEAVTRATRLGLLIL